MMKRVCLCKFVLAGILGALALLPIACNTSQLGETEAEGARRHRRIHRINQSELMADIDRAMLLDEPSRLTDKRIP
jgi:S-adenosylmethionine:diacylglycerol 3-amino-3-carboxypropyl transferase